MKKNCILFLSLLPAISIFAQTGKEISINTEKTEIHTSFDNRKETGFYTIMQVSMIMGGSQSTDKTIYAMPDLTYSSSNIAPTYSYPNNTRTDLSVAPSFTITNGYRFNEHWAAGAGVGFEVFDYNLFPLFAEVRYTVWDTKISPFMVLKGGYSFSSFKSKHYDNLYLNWTPFYVNNADLRQYGGLMIQPEIGVKVPLNENCDVLFSAAYRYQETKSVARRVSDGDQFDEWEHNEDNNRLSFGVAIMFR